MNKLLTEQGKKFIRGVASNKKNNLLKKSDGVFPQVDSNISYSQIEFGENLIKWFDEYSSHYGLDANIIASQCYGESKFRAGVYNNYKGHINAMGITQFVLQTLNDRLFIHRDKNFISQSDVDKLVGDIGLVANKRLGITEIPQNARPDVLKNIANNPDIMIKLQCNYMYDIQKFNDGLASSTLFIYNRGGYGRKNSSYGEAIKKCKIPITEGIGYVDTIFKRLNDNFGYNLVLTKNVSPFGNL